MMHASSAQQPYPLPPARFFWQPEEDAPASALAGRPIFRDSAFIEIWTPGDATNIIRRPVRDHDKRDYSDAWADFQHGAEQKVGGTPLRELAFLTEGQRLEFQAVRVTTVEQLIAMPDTLGQQFPGIHNIKTRAKAYADAAAGNAPLLQLQDQIDKRDAEMADLRAQLAELGNTVAELRRPVAKK